MVRQDWPTQLTPAAHRSITTSSGPNDDDSLALFNAQTTLKRIPAVDRAPEQDPCLLSNALADAVAQQFTTGGDERYGGSHVKSD